MLTCTGYITIILFIAIIPWYSAQTSTQKPIFDREEYLCKDDRVSDETLALLKVEDQKCMDIYLAELKEFRTEDEECVEKSDYSNDKVKDQDNKFMLMSQYSIKYLQCKRDTVKQNRTSMYKIPMNNYRVS